MSTGSMIAILTVIVHEIQSRRDRDDNDNKRLKVAQKALETAIQILKGQ